MRVLLVGIDGATRRVIDPLVREGRLPVLARLMGEGARGVLRSENPMVSPALWTTVVTGRPRAEHGIRHFLSRPGRGDRKVLVRSTDRRALAVWEIVTAAGLEVGFAGWWATWPAEPVRGWIVSDRLTRERWNEWTDGRKREQATHPPSLLSQVGDLVVDPLQPPMDVVARLVDFDRRERAEFLAARRPVFAHGPSVFKFALCSQLSYERIALRLVALRQPDLLGLFLVANDPVSHTFWHYYEPAAFPGVDRRAAARLGRLVPALYEHNDAFLGELLQLVSPDTVVMVVSDHGFRASGVLPRSSPAPHLFSKDDRALGDRVAVGQSGAHDPAGVFLAWGKPIRSREVEATLYDVAPTLLALLGLPVPEDWPGRVLTEALTPEFLARHPVRKVASYDPLVPRLRVEPRTEDPDAEKLDLLRSLGYVP